MILGFAIGERTWMLTELASRIYHVILIEAAGVSSIAISSSFVSTQVGSTTYHDGQHGRINHNYDVQKISSVDMAASRDESFTNLLFFVLASQVDIHPPHYHLYIRRRQMGQYYSTSRGRHVITSLSCGGHHGRTTLGFLGPHNCNESSSPTETHESGSR